MRSKLLFLMLVVGLAFAGPVSAELIVNGSFEDGFYPDGGWYYYGSGSGSDCGGWSSNYTSTLMTDGGSDGSNYVNMDLEGWSCWWVYQAIWTDAFANVNNPDGRNFAPDPPLLISVGDVINFSCQLRDQITGSQLILGYSFYDSDGVILDMNGDGISVDTNTNLDRFDFNLDATSSWQEVTHSFTVPAPLGAGTMHSFDLGIWIWGGSNLDIDEVSIIVGEPHLVHDPDPSPGKQGVSPSTTTLSWQKDHIGGRTPQVELYWGDRDPNFWGFTGGGGEPTKIMALADVNDFNLGDAIGGPITLQPDKVYYWALKYEDPNDGNWGISELVEGPVWSFDTINRPPVVDAGLHYEKWQNASADDITIAIDASYTDDGLPLSGNLTYTWTETHTGIGSSDPCWPDGTDVEDPNVTFSTAGDYILKLTVHDNEGGAQDQFGEDTVLVRIFANDDDRLRAHYPLNGDPCDSVGGHDGTLNDDPVFNPIGQVGGAIELDGTDDVGDDGLNDSVEIGDTGSDPNFQADTWENSDLIDGMTVSAWMKLDEDGWSTNWEAIVAKNNSSWELNRNGSNDNVRFVIQDGVGDAISSGATDMESGWHQVVGVYDRNTVKVYVDGLKAGSVNANRLDLEAESNFDAYGQPINDYDWQVPKAAGKIRIGAGSNVTGGDLAFAGLIDQVRIFDAAVPHRADETGTPGIVEMYRADGGHVNCGGVYIPGDVNEDCYITLVDFATVFMDWLDCNDVADENCPLSHWLE